VTLFHEKYNKRNDPVIDCLIDLLKKELGYKYSVCQICVRDHQKNTEKYYVCIELK
jgi:hypothetical protein